MSHRRICMIIALFAVLISTGFFTRVWWLPWVTSASSPNNAEGDRAHGPIVANQQVKLSAQAKANLGLVVKPLAVDSFWRTVQMPGLIVDRPGQSDRGIVAPVTGVVTKVHNFPGDTVKPGDMLFTLRLVSETLRLTQSDLFKTTQEIEFTKEKRNRLSDLSTQGAVSAAALIEVENQLRRLTIAEKVYRQELQVSGLMPEQINEVAVGKFVSEITVKTPRRSAADNKLLSGLLGKDGVAVSNDAEPSFEVQELKVELGQQVQAGQALCLLSNHQLLYIEGRAFREETPLLEKAAREGWAVQVEFMEGEGSAWPASEQSFTIRHIANTIDTGSRTFAFYLPLVNQARSFEKDERTLMLWRFRPGQKVRLQVRVEKFENVFVLPVDAVVREGPEAYAFRQNGDLFDRKPVHVVHQDRKHVIIANDGSIPAGLFVAQNGATQINRVLRSGSGSLPPGFHMHADGSIHSNAAHK